MKKRLAIVAILLAMLCLCVGACAHEKEEEPPEAPLAFETDLLVKANELELTAHYKQQALGFGEISFLTPETLKDIKLIFEGVQCKIQYKNLSLGTDLTKLPESAFGTALMDALAARLEGVEITKTLQEGKWRFEGNAQAGGFLLVQDAESGNYEFMSIPSIDLTIEFQNFKRLVNDA